MCHFMLCRASVKFMCWQLLAAERKFANCLHASNVAHRKRERLLNDRPHGLKLFQPTDAELEQCKVLCHLVLGWLLGVDSLGGVVRHFLRAAWLHLEADGMRQPNHLFASDFWHAEPTCEV